MFARVTLIVLAAVTIGTLAGSLLRADTDEPNQIQQLQERLEQLEARVAELEKQERVIVVPGNRSGVEPRVRVPRNWGQREFNGMPLYIVPCQQGQEPPSKPEQP